MTVSSTRSDASPGEPAPLRILYHHRIVADDGMRVHVDQIVAALRAADHMVELVGPAARVGTKKSLTARAAGLRGHIPPWVGELLEIGYNIAAYRRLGRAVRAFRPDIIYERYNLFLLAGIWLKTRSGIPLVLEVNAPLAAERAEHGRLQLKSIARWMERAVWRRADMVLPVSDALADHVRGAGVPEKRIRIIPNGIPRASIVPAGVRSSESDDGTVTFGFVGFARPWHGLDRVLDVLAKRIDTPTRLMIVGDGPVLPDLRARAAALGIDRRLTFTGPVHHTEVPDLLAHVSVALQPDVTPYASPLKLFEYMSAGCAIVAPDKANIREILKHGETGLLFDPDTPGSFAAAVDALATDGALRRHLGEAAAAQVREKDMTWEGNAARIAAIAHELSGRIGCPVGAGSPDRLPAAERS